MDEEAAIHFLGNLNNAAFGTHRNKTESELIYDLLTTQSTPAKIKQYLENPSRMSVEATHEF
ncbi:MAG: hypothetical protein F6K00_02670 [Leptolyngbya sp. SIOISBB]|nr:hypothetical protein [Leptolyngbya sp. SIOISBB]